MIFVFFPHKKIVEASGDARGGRGNLVVREKGDGKPWRIVVGLNSHYFHIIGDKLINPSP